MLLLGPPDAEALADPLRRPAGRVAYEYEPGLVEEMVAALSDVSAPGALNPRKVARVKRIVAEWS